MQGCHQALSAQAPVRWSRLSRSLALLWCTIGLRCSKALLERGGRRALRRWLGCSRPPPRPCLSRRARPAPRASCTGRCRPGVRSCWWPILGHPGAAARAACRLALLPLRSWSRLWSGRRCRRGVSRRKARLQATSQPASQQKARAGREGLRAPPSPTLPRGRCGRARTGARPASARRRSCAAHACREPSPRPRHSQSRLDLPG